jgi:sugar phosphate isomerase/epimerase
MRLGGPVFLSQVAPDSWISSLKASGYRAAYCPIDASASSLEIQAYASAARQAGVIIAEVGAWSNPLSPDAEISRKAVEHCQKQLALADEIGAVCCVNIAGSCGARWDGPHADNLTRATFERIVVIVREIIDAVHPVRACYTLEPMPWMYPDSPDSYLDLIYAIDRDHFAVHLDPVNLICSPQRYFSNGDFLRECFKKLGPYIKSCHAKDILLSDHLTTHLDEVRPGLGCLDYRVFLREINRLPVDTPLMLEHLPLQEEYVQAAQYIRSIAQEIGV